MEAFLLNLRALVHRFWLYPASLGDSIELAQHGFFDQVCELFNDERALQRIFVFSPSSLLMMSWMAVARLTLLQWVW